MGALTTNRNKRYAELQFPSSTLLGYDHLHVAKKPKSANGMIPTTSSVSRLSLYPKQVTPISREIQAPILVVKGFTASSSRLDTSDSQNYRPILGNLDSGGDRMGNFLFSEYYRTKAEAIHSCRYFKEKDGKIVKNVDNDNDNDGEGVSGVEEVERQDFNKSVEIQTIRAKYKELDSKAELNLRSQPSTSSGVVSDLVDGKALESLSLNQRLDVMDVDDGVPVHRKLLESARKHDERLRNLGFDIKLQEEKKALFDKLRPAKEEEDVLVEPFRPLTDEEEQIVANALSVSSRKVLVTHEDSNITITGEVLRCLRPGAWLNDEVINLYLELLKEREKKEPKKFLKCHFFNTFFYKKLISGRTGYDYKSVRRWTSQRKLGYSLQECDKIFVPVHKEIHWCLAVINKKEKKFQYLDSLGGIDRQVMRVLANYIVDEVKDKNGKDIDVTSWKQEFVTDLPNQENGYDCGVFMIKYADFYSRDIGLCFKQEHMPYFRKRTAKEILGLNAT
uniref:ubiquitin-like-specific protease ESD4 isoform X2 n=1 Tax=Erigeron canadensis TaxID=72917 RepID=UPI001CB931CB|nr:ubiquitin-like-specific protease ESD4 isoform X2 [Erigeron canadensis]